MHPPLSRRSFFPAPFGLIALFALAHFSHHVPTAILIPLVPFIRDEFVMSYTQAGLLVAAATLSYGIGQLPAGWLADRIGPRLLIAAGIAGVAAAGFAVGLSRTYTMLLVCLVVLGLVGGGYHPAASPLLSAAVGAENRGRALGFHLVGGSLSHFLAPLLAGLLAAAWGWRGSYLSLAAPIAAFGVLLYLLLPGRLAGPARPAAGAPDPRPPAAVRLPALAAFLFLASTLSAVEASVIAFLPLFMVDRFRVSEPAAAALLAVIYAAGVGAAPLGGYLSDRIGARRILAGVGLTLGPVILLAGYIPYGPGFIALLAAFGVLMFLPKAASESFIVGSTAARLKSTVMGIYFFAGMEGSALLTPLLGAAIDRIGFRAGFALAGALLAAVTLGCMLVLWKGGPHTSSTTVARQPPEGTGSTASR
jgi:predicted MFS family arabinose efflux permease